MLVTETVSSPVKGVAWRWAGWARLYQDQSKSSGGPGQRRPSQAWSKVPSLEKRRASRCMAEGQAGTGEGSERTAAAAISCTQGRRDPGSGAKPLPRGFSGRASPP